MKVRMQKTSAQANGYPQRDRSATERYEGVVIGNFVSSKIGKVKST